MINTVNQLAGFYLQESFLKRNLEQGVNNSVIKKDTKINHVQACATNYRLNKIAKPCIME